MASILAGAVRRKGRRGEGVESEVRTGSGWISGVSSPYLVFQKQIIKGRALAALFLR